MDMSFKQVLASSLLSVLLLCFVASTAGATAIYTYQGNPFNDFRTRGAPSFPPYDSSNAVTISIVLAAPLAPNTGAAYDDVIAFTFNDGQATLDETNSKLNDGFGAFGFGVGADGLPYSNSGGGSWILLAAELGTLGIERLQRQINSWGIDQTATFNTPPYDSGSQTLLDAQGSEIDTTFGAVFDNPGTWSLVVIPEPGTALLMGLGLTALGWRGRVRQSWR
jgi:hypothetical protein